jgi:OmpA-OmpF porin, OOP family
MKLKSAVYGLIAALPALVANSVMAANDDSGFYLGGGLGVSNYKADCPQEYSCSNPTVNFKLLAGYKFMPNFALEGGYNNYGKIKQTYDAGEYGKDKHKYSLHNFTLAGVGIIPVGNEMQLFGKLGMHFSRLKYSRDDSIFGQSSGSSHYNKNGLLMGAGFQFDFTRNLAGRVEYEAMHYGSNPVRSSDYLHVLSTSLVYKF